MENLNVRRGCKAKHTNQYTGGTVYMAQMRKREREEKKKTIHGVDQNAREVKDKECFIPTMHDV